MKTILKNPIKNPRITEKASLMQEQNVYSFNVSNSANKNEISRAIFELYKVKPVKVNILAVPRKAATYRGKPGTKGGGKKALVYLKQGDKIDFI